MYKIALTGSIGAGKTTVSKVFEEIGIPVFNSDLSARKAESDPEIITALKEIIGDDAFDGDVIIRDIMRKKVFSDNAMLDKINDLITPWVIKDFKNFITQKELEGYKIVVLESAIIFESKQKHVERQDFDVYISVFASEETRRKRVKSRDNISDEIFDLKTKSQLPELEKLSLSNFIIINEDVEPELRKLLLESQIGTILALFMLERNLIS